MLELCVSVIPMVDVKSVDSDEQLFSACYFNFYISGARKLTRDSQSQIKEKKKSTPPRLWKVWWALKKFG
jgi:hypothetical protein